MRAVSCLNIGNWMKLNFSNAMARNHGFVKVKRKIVPLASVSDILVTDCTSGRQL